MHVFGLEPGPVKRKRRELEPERKLPLRTGGAACGPVRSWRRGWEGRQEAKPVAPLPLALTAYCFKYSQYV